MRGPADRARAILRPGEIEYTKLGEIIRCPWHGWEFDIRTGQSYCDPKRFRARAYPVNVEPGSSVVKGPYVAETLAVSVESDYVVVDERPSYRREAPEPDVQLHLCEIPEFPLGPPNSLCGSFRLRTR